MLPMDPMQACYLLVFSAVLDLFSGQLDLL